jgi:BMFP domain-containing protein YqiC
VPPGLRESREELQATFKSALQAGLAKLDLVTREEFEVQRAVLLKTRQKLDAETAVRELEGRGAGMKKEAHCASRLQIISRMGPCSKAHRRPRLAGLSIRQHREGRAMAQDTEWTRFA